MAEWFEDELFWQNLYGFLFSDERMSDGEEEIERALSLVDVSSGGVLDLACGPGRHAVPLAQRGFAVTGVDVSPFLLDRARQRATTAHVEIEWVQSDMRRFERPDSFDLALLMFTSFGYFDSQDEDQQVLEKARLSLKPGAPLLLDLLGKENLARTFEPAQVHELADGGLLVERHWIEDDWNRVRNEWILIQHGMAMPHHFHLNLYSGQELRDRLERAGFSRVELYGDLDGGDYGPEAPRLVAVAWK